MDEREQQAYTEGERAVWTRLLGECLRNLGYDEPTVQAVAWVKEREAIVAQLRQVCRDFGNNDWPDDLSLADVIDKYLAGPLHAAKPDYCDTDDVAKALRAEDNNLDKNLNEAQADAAALRAGLLRACVRLKTVAYEYAKPSLRRAMLDHYIEEIEALVKNHTAGARLLERVEILEMVALQFSHIMDSGSVGGYEHPRNMCSCANCDAWRAYDKLRGRPQ